MQRKRDRKRLFLPFVFLTVALSVGGGRAYKEPGLSDFRKVWNDGKSELSGYSLIQPRYGELRHGTAVLIFGVETHGNKTAFQMKVIKDFQTGLFSSHWMTTVWAPSERSFNPSKISFSSQEWLGSKHQELSVRENKVQGAFQSYAEGEGGPIKDLPLSKDGLFEDDLPILVRELTGVWIAPGSQISRPCLPSLYRSALNRAPLEWGSVSVWKGKEVETLATSAGKFEVVAWKVKPSFAPAATYWVEKAYPHRIIRWRSDDGEEGTLLGSARYAYWAMNLAGDEVYRKSLGLKNP